MNKITKNHLVVASLAALLLAITIPMASAFTKHSKRYFMPYATTIIEDTENTDDEACTEDTCGSEDEMTEEEQKAAEAAIAAEEAAEEAAAKKAEEEATLKAAETKKKAEEAKKAAAEKVIADKAAAEKAAAEKVIADKVAAEKAAAEKVIADKAAAEKAAAEAAEKAAVPKVPTGKTVADQREAAEEAAAKAEAEKKAQEELVKKEEEIKKQAEAELLAKQAEEQSQTKEQEKFLESIATTTENREIVAAVQTAETPRVTDANSNGVPDDLETSLGINTKKVDEEMVTIRAQLAVREQTLISGGSSRVEAAVIIKKELTQRKAENKVGTIRKVAAAKYGSKILNSKQDSRGDGSSDEVAVSMGVDPKTKITASDEFYPVEKKLYGMDTKITEVVALKKCSMSISTGNKLPSKGFTVLAACPKNKTFTLYMLGKNGRSVELKTAKSSENSKLVFMVEKGVITGKSILYIKQVKQVTSFLPSLWFANTLGSEDEEETTSDPVVVDIVPETDIEQPVVKNIENIDIAGIKDIKISATSDGKVRVTGLADISTMVIGTFSSAVFTSAILADVENGGFEVVSARPLPPGDHEVVIYATKPEEQIQSTPIKLKFSIIPVARAAAEEVPARNQLVPEPAGFPIIPVAGGAIAVVLAALVIVYVKRARKTQ